MTAGTYEPITPLPPPLTPEESAARWAEIKRLNDLIVAERIAVTGRRDCPLPTRTTTEVRRRGRHARAGLATAVTGVTGPATAARAGLATAAGSAGQPAEAGSSDARFRQRHREARRQQTRKYLTEHPRDPEAERERVRAWRADHPEAAREISRKGHQREHEQRAAARIGAGGPVATGTGTAQRPIPRVGAHADLPDGRANA